MKDLKNAFKPCEQYSFNKNVQMSENNKTAKSDVHGFPLSVAKKTLCHMIQVCIFPDEFLIKKVII